MVCSLLFAAVFASGAPADGFPRPGGEAAAASTSNFTADAGPWTDVREEALPASAGRRLIVPLRYRLLAVDRDHLMAVLDTAPPEFAPGAREAAAILSLPLPDGSFGRFAVVDSPIMEPALAARYPGIRTFAAQGIDDPTATARLDWTPRGFHAMVLSGVRGAVFIDPCREGDTTHYISYDKRDFVKADTASWRCHVDESEFRYATPLTAPEGVSASTGPQLRTYRLAVGATGEYSAFHGGTVPLALAAIVTSVNRVDGVYERETAIRMVLVANEDQVIYTNASTDPYSNSSPSALLSENQTTLDAVIGDANYDIGHVFSTGGGGLAQLRVPCVSGSKARGETGSSAPVGDPYDIDYVAHEMGHQWGGDHTFNGSTSACSGNRASTSAYEPGSGSTIMAYAGICGAEDLQPHSDPYFHGRSFDQIVSYSTTGNGNSCAVTTATGNHAPTVNAGSAYTIPARTPFTLTGSATDLDGDPLTYCWEEFDLGPKSPPNTDDGSRPIFRSFNPTPSPSRTFPQLSDILSDTSTFGEASPVTDRTMTFRLTARDNRMGGGGVAFASTTVTVVSAAGPFHVTAPAAGATWTAGGSQTVTWNVASTTAAPISCSQVSILLSFDGGQTFPRVLAAATANDGSEAVTVPPVNTTTARIKVQAVGNIFFDISSGDFTLQGAVAPAAIDCNMDGKSDILWRNDTSGDLSVWYVNGSGVIGSGFLCGVSGTTWQVAGAGDFDGNGYADVLWRNSSTGALSIWRVGASGLSGSLSPGTVGSPWKITGIADADGDGCTDIFWRNTSTGDLSAWLINAFGVKSVLSLGGAADANWDVLGAADFNADGRADVFWRHRTSGTMVVWLVGVTGVTGQVPLGAVDPAAWKVNGLGDVDGDRCADIVWRNDASGMLSVWLVNGSGYRSSLFVGGIGDLDWKVVGVGDFNGDGKADIFWRHAVMGTMSVWFASGTGIIGQMSPGTVDLAWKTKNDVNFFPAP
ncbi:MAG: hypothetical protein KA419_11120 [Acidobacteria bacterium]|nr:hypothetical protein [Acidobacteriota bacterium]